jgi:alpha-methylacyl-CoA racemase
MEALGLGPEPLLARCPRLVYGRMTGWGQHGPLARAAGHDLNYLALTGALHAIGTGGDDGRPLPPLNLVGDYGGGAMFLAMGVLAALLERQRSGRGQVVDAAMVDGVSALAGLFQGLRAAGTWTARRHDNLLDGGAPFYDCYRCADGGFVALAALEPKFFAEFARLVGLDAAWVPRQYERAAWPALREAIAAVFAGGTRAHWCALLEGSDACVAPVLSFDEAPAHAHAVARGGYVPLDGVSHPAPAPRLSRSGAVPPRPAPQPGQHSAEVLAEIGVRGAAAEALFAQGVVR